MKKRLERFLAIFVIFIMSCSFVPQATAAQTTDNKILLGDVNGNNKIDELDYIFVKRFYFKTLKLTDDALFRADVNQDNKVNAFDYLLIKRMYFETYDYQYISAYVTPHEMSADDAPQSLTVQQKELIKYMFQYLDNSNLPSVYKTNTGHHLTQKDSLSVASFITYYFGCHDALNTVEIAYSPSLDLPSILRLNLTNYTSYNDTRKDFDKTFTSALSTMKNGSDKSIANQIAEYLCASTKYNPYTANVSDLVNKHTGSCNAYAIAFYRMCKMAGIDCDIVYGYANGYHCWNRIKTENDEYLYYDLTFYEASNSDEFIAAPYIRDYASVNRFLTNEEIEKLS